MKMFNRKADSYRSIARAEGDNGEASYDARRRWRGAVCTGLAFVGMAVISQPASAYTLLQMGNCNQVTWTSPPEVVVHINEFFAGGGNADDLTAMYAATYDVREQFNMVGATSAAAYEAYIGVSISPFEAGDWFNDATPTIHVGFTDNPADANGAAAATIIPAPDANCHVDEVHIVVQDLNHTSWSFGTPAEVDDDYYTAGETDPTAKRYFRTAYLHELLHAFGLNHSDHSYSFMNYNYFPWAGGGRDEREAVRPLPDDVEALRDLYPAAGSRTEVAVLNTWFDPGAVYNNSAIQHGLCATSLGDTFSSSIFRFAPGCGEGGPNSGSTRVCAGDRLYTRFAFANYSTETADDIDVRLWFSTDEEFDLTDPLSPTQREITVGAQRSGLIARTWLVPSTLIAGTEYYVIVQVAGTTSSGAYVGDWIPLRGKVTAC